MKIVNFAEENSLVGQFLTEMRDVKRQNDPCASATTSSA